MDLVSIFSWRSEVEVRRECARLNDRYWASTAKRLQYALSVAGNESNEAPSPASLRQRLDELSDASCLRILTSPELCHRIWGALSGESGALRVFLDAAIRAEEIRAGSPAPLHQETWSASGDVFFPAGFAGGRGADVATEPALTWSSASIYRAPVLSCGPVMDYFSPYANRSLVTGAHLDWKFGDATPFSDAEIQAVDSKFHEAAAGLFETSPAALDFVGENLRTVMARKDARPSFKGSSTRVFMGRANSYNPHAARVQSGHIAQSLVHESIHTFLYKIEDELPTVEDGSVAYDTRIESPWTGTRLPLQAYVHASIVWYSLGVFFRLPSLSQRFSSECVTYYREGCRKGFLDRQMMKRIEPYRSAVRPEMMDQLSAFQSAALDFD